MADVIQTENSSTGIVVGILVALIIAVAAYFIIANRDSGGPDISVNMPAASGPATGGGGGAAGTAQ